MAKKKLGYVELFWTCPNCGTLNPGDEKVCQNCGAPQPEDVQFIQKPGQKISQDEKLAERAKKGPDIHCPYCGARNPADAKVCSQCGGDLTGGDKREVGRVVGAYKAETQKPIICPNCGAENPGDAVTCQQCGANLRPEQSQPAAPKPPHKKTLPASAKSPANKAVPLVFIIIFALLCVGAGIFILLSMKTKAVTGEVVGVHWERSIAIEALAPAEHQDWRDQIPSEAEIESCQQEERYIQDEPTANATEVCGTPYTVDSGTGVGEVVQDCEYHVYDDFCTYTVMEWQVVDTISAAGDDLNAYWPETTLSSDQRFGEKEETYSIYFDSSQGNYTYTTQDYNLFQSCEIGSKWSLNINTFGNLVSIER